MATRPTPIIVPSSGGLGGIGGQLDSTNTDIKIDLEAFRKFFGGAEADRGKETEAIIQGLKELGDLPKGQEDPIDSVGLAQEGQPLVGVGTGQPLVAPQSPTIPMAPEEEESAFMADLARSVNQPSGANVPPPDSSEFAFREMGQSDEGLGVLRKIFEAKLGGKLAAEAPAPIKTSSSFNDIAFTLGYSTEEEQANMPLEDRALANNISGLSSPVKTAVLSQYGGNLQEMPDKAFKNAFLLDQADGDVRVILLETDMPLENLSSKQYAAARKQAKGEAVELHRAKTTAEHQAIFTEKLDEPLSTPDTKNLVHVDTGKHPVYGTTLREAINGQWIPITATEQGQLLAADSIGNLVAKTKELINNAPLAEGSLDRVAGAPARWAGMKAQTKDYIPLVELNSWVGGTLAPIIRYFGEKGALSNTDIERAMKFMPHWNDTREAATAKLNNLIDFFKSKGLDIDTIPTQAELDAYQAEKAAQAMDEVF